MTSKAPLNLNGKLFQVTEESSDGKIKAKCSVWLDSKPPLSGSKKTTSNFLLNLKRKHPAKASEFEKSKRARQDDSQKEKTPTTTQTTIFQFCKSKKVTQDAASKAIVNLVVFLTHVESATATETKLLGNSCTVKRNSQIVQSNYLI